MKDSDFVEIFNVAQSGYRDWWFPACGLLFFALVGAALILTNLRIIPAKLKAKPRQIWLLLVFSIVWTLGSSIATYRDYTRSRHLLLSGNADYVEGIVQNFSEIPYKSESFTVDGVPFRYSDYVVSAGFNHTSSNGGPIRPGLYVRIWYRSGGSDWSNEILKLEMRKASA